MINECKGAMKRTFRLNEFGYEVEIGKVARQADGAAWFKQGGTVILATVTSAQSKEFPGFFPLTVDYREQFSAAGKIPGGYYKREGKSSDQEVLTGRLIDRAIRPLFAEHYFDQVQIIATAFSVDKEHSPSVMALTAASIALVISKIPFAEPVGAVEICRVDGAWVVNPQYKDVQRADARIIVAGTHDGICMVEGNAKELSEDEFVEALFTAHAAIKRIVVWQREIAAACAMEKVTIPDPYGWDVWGERVKAFLNNGTHIKNLYTEKKHERNEYMQKIKAQFNQQHADAIAADKIPTNVLDYIFDTALEPLLTEHICETRKRVDGRTYDTIRPISVEVGVLPFTHGSALFTRGETQALVSATLGSGQDEQRIESIMEEGEKTSAFMLHYNFPPFSVGEVKSLRAPGRREVGHGHLAASGFKYVLPSKEGFPYTIRIVSDILESNGSSSMATVCGTTMALMHAGVPLTTMVGGIAMGLLKSERHGFAVLSDINGFEDAFGLMDFKVVGTDNGITAIQMDIKHRGGFSRDVFEKALEQARQGRTHILGVMASVMSKPSPTLSALVPKVVTIMINTDKIGAVIGSGGKVIREIVEKTGTQIDIEPDGLVKIFAPASANLDLAVRWVKTLAGQIEPGSYYDGIIRRIAEFGLFVELMPGMDGLVHVSNIPRELQKTFSRHYKPNDPVRVKVLDYDETTGRTSLRIEDK